MMESQFNQGLIEARRLQFQLVTTAADRWRMTFTFPPFQMLRVAANPPMPIIQFQKYPIKSNEIKKGAISTASIDS